MHTIHLSKVSYFGLEIDGFISHWTTQPVTRKTVKDSFQSSLQVFP